MQFWLPFNIARNVRSDNGDGDYNISDDDVKWRHHNDNDGDDKLATF